MERLFFDTKTNSCVLVPKKPIVCSHCKTEVVTQAIVQRSYSKILPPRELFFCSRCGGHNIKRDLDFFSVARIEDKIKDSYRLINEHTPEIRKGEIDLFKAAHFSSEKTEDKTAYSGYDTWEGAKIGDSSFQEREERKIIYETEVDRFLENIRIAKPIMPKQLEAQNV
jgi:hypothetical protein